MSHAAIIFMAFVFTQKNGILTSELNNHTKCSIRTYVQRYNKHIMLKRNSRFVGNGHCHEVFIADSNRSVKVGITSSEGFSQRSKHNTALNEIIKLQEALGEAIKAKNN